MNGTNSLSGSGEVRTAGEIYDAVSRLQAVIARCEDVTAQLRSRLSPVLLPEYPEISGDNKDSELQSELGQQINGLRIRLRDITNRLELLADRVAL